MNKSLPIYGFKDQILEAVRDSGVVVITAETGAGKSTQVPQFLMEEGYQVVVTQPRRLAARTVSERVAEEVGCRLGGRIGYRTGFERMDSRETQVLFCTDGLQLVREITGVGRAQVLVIDEVHEWNINIETLVAWARKQITEGWQVKVVLMSATLEADKLAAFYGNVPVIEVPGRLFPVESKEDNDYNLISNIKKLVEENRNVLVFQPGKKEIAKTCDALEDCGAIVLPLHGELDPADQKKCFQQYDQPKVVVATNVAQTSITIPDIDAVVDSGIERRVELADGIEGLYLKPISQADCQQRKGRAGRTKEGVYILCSDTSLSERPTFPTAEIERSRLDQLVLRLAAVGIDATELEFFHQPDRNTLADAKRTLHALGAMTDNGQVTKIGRLMAKLPVSVQFARMIVEAEQYGVVGDVVTLAAILEIGGIRDRSEKWRQFTQEKESDLLAELDLWKITQGKPAKELPEYGIFKKSYFRVKELRRKLFDSIRGRIDYYSVDDREAVKRACVAGMVDHLYQNKYGEYQNGSGGTRQKARESVVTGSPDWVVGLPKDIQFKNRRGCLCTLNLVSMVTKVDPTWLVEVAPQLVKIEEGLSPYFNVEQDSCFSTTRTHFNGQMVKEEKVGTPEHEKAADVFADWFAGALAAESGDVSEALKGAVEYNRQIQKQARGLNIRADETIFKIMSQSEWKEWLVAERLNGARRVFEITNLSAIQLLELDSELVAKVLADNPDTVNIEGIILTIEYGKEYYDSAYCRTNVEEEFARQVKTEVVVLPGGRTVDIRCGEHSAKTFAELVEKLETSRIKRCWSDKRSELEHTSWISDPEKVFPHLSKLLSAVEITQANNGEGELIFGYVSLFSDSDPDFKIKLKESEEEAKKETKIGLERLLQKASRNVLVIPKEEPWQKESDWSWSLTDLGQALKNRFETLITEHAENLTSNNIEEQIEALKTAVESIKAEIGGEHEAVRQLIETTEQKINGKINAINDSYFVESEVESEVEQVREAIQEAKDYLKSAAYGDVKAACEIAVETANQLQTLCDARSQSKAEAEELLQSILSKAKEVVDDGYYNDLYTSEECDKIQTTCNTAEKAFDAKKYEQVAGLAGEVRQAIEEARAGKQIRDYSAKLLDQYLEQEYAECPVCGQSTDPQRASSDYDYCSHYGSDDSSIQSAFQVWAERNSKDQEEEKILVKISKVGEEELISLVAVYDRYDEQYRLRLNVNSLILLTDDTQIITEVQWVKPSQEETRLFELQQEAKRYDEEVKRAKQMVQDNEALKLSFHKSRHPKTDADQWESGNKYCKYIVDFHSDLEIESEKQYYCYIGRTLVDTGRFQLILVQPFLEADRATSLSLPSSEK
ncbi:DEAD/DEAH box helicase [Patescibacteria group bacterium]|nr:DEAD/DEAH box helicase [Patescibacteria group bacterium]